MDGEIQSLIDLLTPEEQRELSEDLRAAAVLRREAQDALGTFWFGC